MIRRMMTIALLLALGGGGILVVDQALADPPAKGLDAFMELEGEEAERYGRELAVSDYQKGIRRILVYGLRKGPREDERILAEQYEVQHVAIAGCVVSDGIVKGARAYNETMKKLLLETYRRDIFEEVRKELEKRQREIDRAQRDQ